MEYNGTCYIVPVEIKKRGPKAVEGYITALKKGKKKMPRCKLVILGEAGVGKTNLLNLLTGEKFVPTHERTEGVEISLVATFDIDTKTWKKSPGGEGDAEYIKIAATEVANQLKDTKPNDKTNILPTPKSLYQKFNSVMKKYSEPPARPKSDLKPAATRYAPSSERSQFPKSTKPDVPTVAEWLAAPKHKPSVEGDMKERGKKDHPRGHFAKLPELPSHHVVSQDDAAATASKPLSLSSSTHDLSVNATNTPPSGSTDISASGGHFYTIILRDASKKKSSEPLALHLKLTSFDFAGQEHYKSMHPCFMTSRAVYIVTFNVRHLLTDRKDQCINEINYWVNSILVHASEDAKVILVGTHRGPHHDFDELNEKSKCDINGFLKKELKNNFVFSFFKDDRIMALVENSIENNEDRSGAKVVRERLKVLGEGHPGNKDDLPLSYLRLESKIFEERSERSKNNFLAPRDEVEKWADNFGIDDIGVALDFFHDIGIIVNPGERNL